MKRTSLIVAACVALAAPGLAAAQSGDLWPNKPVRLLVGYPPGGASDLFGRMIAAQMGPRLGHNVVVENRPGGGAVVASEAVSRSAPDGNTLLHVDNGILVYNPALYARLPYDPDRDLSGVGFIGRFPLFLVVRADSPSTTGRSEPVTVRTTSCCSARVSASASPKTPSATTPCADSESASAS